MYKKIQLQNIFWFINYVESVYFFIDSKLLSRSNLLDSNIYCFVVFRIKFSFFFSSVLLRFEENPKATKTKRVKVRMNLAENSGKPKMLEKCPKSNNLILSGILGNSFSLPNQINDSLHCSKAIFSNALLQQTNKKGEIF